MANIVIPFAAVSHQPVPSVGFNNNFTEVAAKFNQFAVQTDVAKVITVGHTWNAAQMHNSDILFGDALYDIGKAGATRPRDIFVSRTVTIGTSLLLPGTAFALLGSPTNTSPLIIQAQDNASHIYLRNAAGANVFSNSLDTLGSNYVIYDQVNGRVVLQIQPGAGAGSFNIFNDFKFTDNTYDIGKSGASRPRDLFLSRNLTIGGALLGNLVFSAAASKILPGVTSLSLRNNADTADNVLISDIGNMTVRLGITAGGGITAPITATSGSFHATPSAADPAISTSDGDFWILTSGAFKAKLNGSVRTLWHSGMVSSGYAAWTGTTNRASVFDQSTATLANVAQRLAAIQNDLMTAGVLSI